jgi:hypothetical protein
MLICDRCNTELPDTARFCPACADPVTGADRLSARPAQETERVRLVCPACEEQSLFDIPAHGQGEERCPACSTEFTTRVVRIRSKRSSGNKRYDERSFTIRVEDLAGREDLIEFTRPSSDDFELKSKDLAAFSSLDGRLHVVQNMTVGRSMRVVRPLPPPAVPQQGCGGSMALAGFVSLLMLGFCGMILSSASPDASSRTRASDVGEPITYRASTPSPPPPFDLLYVHGSLNVRTTPSRAGGTVRTLSRGDLVRLGDKDANGWAPLYDASGNREGYVYRASDLVRSTAPGTAPVYAQQAGTGRRSGTRGYYTGPRGGCYTYSASGRKRYVDRSYCR